MIYDMSMCIFHHRYVLIQVLQISITNLNFYTFEVVGRGSESQLRRWKTRYSNHTFNADTRTHETCKNRYTSINTLTCYE